MLDNNSLKEILKKLTDAYSPSGYEEEVKEIVNSELEKISDEIVEDRMGNKAWIMKGKGKNKPVVSFIAHGDEVGFIVENILDSGFLQVIELGGWNSLTISSQLMKIKSKDSWINGITTAAAPHLISKDEKNKSIEKIYIDIGAKSKEEVEALGIFPGTPVVPENHFIELLNNRIISKAFDNRVGVAMLIGLGHFFHKNKDRIPVDIQLAVSVQEEVGVRGASTFYKTFKPDYAIILEGPPADDTPELSSSLKQGVLGNGPQIRTYDKTMIPSKKLVDKLKEASLSLKKKIQLSVRSTGGTDGMAIHKSGPGVPSVVFSIPVRGAHSPHSVIDFNDLIDSVEVLCRFVEDF